MVAPSDDDNAHRAAYMYVSRAAVADGGRGADQGVVWRQ